MNYDEWKLMVPPDPEPLYTTCTYCSRTDFLYEFIYNKSKEPVCEMCVQDILPYDLEEQNENLKEFSPEQLEKLYGKK